MLTWLHFRPLLLRDALVLELLARVVEQDPGDLRARRDVKVNQLVLRHLILPGKGKNTLSQKNQM